MLWCWRRLLRAPWTAWRSNQWILKEISPECSLEGLMLKLQYFSPLMWRTDSLEKTLMLGKIEGWRRRERQRMRWFDGITTQWQWLWASSGNFGQQGLACCSPWGHKESDTTKRLHSTELSYWTELKKKLHSQRNEVFNILNESHCSSERKVREATSFLFSYSKGAGYAVHLSKI